LTKELKLRKAYLVILFGSLETKIN
jgi:hypothetical protein